MKLPTLALLTVFSALRALGSTPAENHDVRVQNSGNPRPKLIFACDKPTSGLDALFTPDLIADLKELKAGVALSTSDFTPERAKLVRKLNAAGIPMTAWLVLPADEGYYVNASNAAQTAARFKQFDQWTTDNSLRWAALGLDIEPTLTDFAKLAGNKGRLLALMLRRGFDSSRVRLPHEAYAALIEQMQGRGYYVQTYQLQFIADERRAHTTLLERLFGIVDVRGNEELLMLYTSFTHAAGAGIIWEYGPDAQAIAIGSTAASGDPSADAKFPPLNWDEFLRDAIVAHSFSEPVGIYSLDGCVRQGFISRLKTVDWNQPMIIPGASVAKAAKFRRVVFAVLWVSSHLIYLVAGFLLATALLVRAIVRRRRQKRAAVEERRPHFSQEV